MVKQYVSGPVGQSEKGVPPDSLTRDGVKGCGPMV